MSNFEIGDRVSCVFLGEGTVTDGTDIDFLVTVKYDRTPPIEYNMGENPTAELVSKLVKIL